METQSKAKDFIKDNFAILLAFLLPLVLIFVIAISTYLPSRLLSTNYNFIYASCTNGTDYYTYPCNNYLGKRFSVINGRLSTNAIDDNLDENKDGVPDIRQNYTARIFFHDTQKNESHEISLDEAKTLTLNDLLTSPDSVTVSSNYSYNGGDFFFFGGGSSSYGHYLTKGKSKKLLNLINNTDRYYYRDNFQFLGWVLPGRN